MPTAPGYADCSHQLSLSGFPRPAYITFGCDPVDTDPNVIATSLVAAFGATGSMYTRIDSAVTLTGTRVSLGTDGGEDLIGFSAQNVGCQLATNTTTPNTAWLVHKRTARGGRRGRGRIFIPWSVPETGVDEAGTIDTSSLNSMQTALTAWFDALAAGGEPMYLLHNPGLTSMGPPDRVTALEADRIISTQRRRLGRR